MSVSSIVKFRMNNDRSAAEALERAMYGVAQNNKSVLQDVNQGLRERRGTAHAFLISMRASALFLKKKTNGF